MKHNYILLILIFFWSSCAGAQSTNNVIKRVELLDYGILNINKIKTIDTSLTASGKYTIAKMTSVKKTTDLIIAKKHEAFGITYKVIGNPHGTKVLLTIKIIHPPIKGRTSSKAKIWAYIGEPDYTFYSFDEDYELLEGKWKIQIWNKNKKLLEKVFHIKK